MEQATAVDAAAEDRPREVRSVRARPDRVFRAITTGSGFLVFVLLFLIGAFLLYQGLPAFKLNGLHFFTTSAWEPDSTTHHSGVAAVLFGTIVIAFIAVALAIPIALLSALFLTEYAPLRLRRPFTSLIDLLAAIPSLIYGIWGFFFLQDHLLGTERWLTDHLGFLPIFRTDPGASLASSPFIVGCVVGLMVLPVATSVMREVFSQAPAGEKEAALALGGSRWAMIRTVVLPFGRGGIIGGSMLGLGRALSETIAIAIIISPAFIISSHILQSGGNSVAALIALRFGDASREYGVPALMAAGLVLFMITLVVNTFASTIVARSRSGHGVEI
jgi:phosphate transport system permease protein